MEENRFTFRVVNQKDFFDAMEKNTKEMLNTILHGWRDVGIQLLRRITIRYLSGRPGLRRISGNAARAMNVKTSIVGRDIIQKWEATGAGSSYLPTHEGNEAGGAKVIMHPGTSNGFGKGISIPAHPISIPKRTNIYNDITDLGDRLRIKSINDAIRSFA